MSRHLLVVLASLVLLFDAAASTATCPAKGWADWQQTQMRMLSHDGRVIDFSDPRQITTSEGQSYALFFALVDNNQPLFNNILQWTQDNLARGDLSSNLPAWLWGKKEDASQGVIDDNSASDSDLWIAYTLVEAGRLWKIHQYASLGQQMLQLISSKEVADIPGLGTMLLPAPKGFVDDGQFRLNPSYVPPQVVARLAHGFGEPWSQMSRNVPRLLIETSPHGLAPNWTRWVAQEGFKPANDQERTGSYDAIRVYLWVGMLDSQATDAQTLKDHFRAIGRFVDAQGYVTETINVMTGTAEGNSTAGPGFSAALLPLLQKSSIGPRLFNAVDSPREQPLGYYNQMLTLFGKGWFEGRFQFDKDGRLEPSWMHCQ